MSFIFKIFWKIVDIAFFSPTRICTAFPEAILLCSECLPYSFLWWISSLLVFCSMCYFMTFTRTAYLICCQEENFTSSLKKGQQAEINKLWSRHTQLTVSVKSGWVNSNSSRTRCWSLCVRRVRVPASASSFFLFPLIFFLLLLWSLAPPSSMSSFHSPQLIMSPAASDVKVSQAEGTMELRQNVNLSARARFCVFFLCVCVWLCERMCISSHGLLKIPFAIHSLARTHRAPLNPCRGIKQCCRSERALFSHPPTPPLSSFVFHFPLQGNLFLFLPLHPPFSLSLYVNIISFFFSFSTSLFCFKSGDYQKLPRLCLACEIIEDSKPELREYWTAHSSVLSLFSLFDLPPAGEHSCSDTDCCRNGPADCSSRLRHVGLFNRLSAVRFLALQQQSCGSLSNWPDLSLTDVDQMVFANIYLRSFVANTLNIASSTTWRQFAEVIGNHLFT